MPEPTLKGIRTILRSSGDPQRALGTARFFKTGRGEYGEGDKFLGIRVPDLRRIVRAHRGLSLADTLALLQSGWHEERAVALLLLVDAHARGSATEKRQIHREYLANTRYINNWDLVDSSAGEIVGSHVPERGTGFLEKLARSNSLWERRIAMIATFWSIKHDDFAPTLRIAEQLLDDEHDLIHKAVGWMLREAGNRDVTVLRAFLDTHAATMPRTALRYAIERLGPDDRRRYMGAKADVART
ncbi:MAG: DNA alkylation repair protein [Gemmatimonadota bacterium]